MQLFLAIALLITSPIFAADSIIQNQNTSSKNPHVALEFPTDEDVSPESPEYSSSDEYSGIAPDDNALDDTYLDFEKPLISQPPLTQDLKNIGDRVPTPTNRQQFETWAYLLVQERSGNSVPAAAQPQSDANEQQAKRRRVDCVPLTKEEDEALRAHDRLLKVQHTNPDDSIATRALNCERFPEWVERTDANLKSYTQLLIRNSLGLQVPARLADRLKELPEGLLTSHDLRYSLQANHGPEVLAAILAQVRITQEHIQCLQDNLATAGNSMAPRSTSAFHTTSDSIHTDSRHPERTVLAIWDNKHSEDRKKLEDCADLRRILEKHQRVLPALPKGPGQTRRGADFMVNGKLVNYTDTDDQGSSNA